MSEKQKFKKFRDVQYGDYIWNSNTGKKTKVTNIDYQRTPSGVSTKLGLDGMMPREVKNPLSSHSGIDYGDYYTTELEYKQNRKKILLKSLNDKKKKAEEAFNEVKKFRRRYYKELNIELIDRELNKLNPL